MISALRLRVRDGVFGFVRFLAVRRLRLSKAKVVGVTGSVGKTSTKEMVAAVLSEKYRVKRSEGNLNTEWGMCWTLLELDKPHRNLFSWAWTLTLGAYRAFFKVPRVDFWVLEMGVDRPGDMDRLLSVARPHYMLFLNVADVHIGEGQFENADAIFKEKSRAVYGVVEGGTAFLNADDERVSTLTERLPCKTVAVKAQGRVHVTVLGMELRPEVQPPTVLKIPALLSEEMGLNAMMAVSVGLAARMPMESIQAGLLKFHLPPGRLNPLAGVNGSLLIDGSYNASPKSVLAALKVLERAEGRKIAVIGTMNELGDTSDEWHLKIGQKTAEIADVLVFVGEQASMLADGARRHGVAPEHLHRFVDAISAGRFLQKFLEKGDTALFKGSQNGVRLERAVAQCLAEPSQAAKLLVRHDSHWLKTP